MGLFGASIMQSVGENKEQAPLAQCVIASAPQQVGDTTYLYTSFSSFSMTISYACYATGFFIVKDDVRDRSHFSTFFADIFFDFEDGCRVLLRQIQSELGVNEA